MTLARALALVAVVTAAAATLAYIDARAVPTHEALRILTLAPALAATDLLEPARLTAAARAEGVLRDAAARLAAVEPALDHRTLRAATGARVAGVANAEVVLTATAADPADAAARADALVDALDAWARGAAAAASAVLVADLDDRVRAAEERIRELQALGGTGAADEIASLLGARRDAAMHRDALVGAAEVPQALRVQGQEVRRLDGRPVERAAMAGALAAIGAASLLLASVALRLRQDAQATLVAGAPIVAEFPSGGPHHEARFGEAAFALARRLASATGEVPGRVFVVTSPEKHALTSAVARGVAEALCRPGTTTLLVDADLRAPAVSGAYGIAQQGRADDAARERRPVSTTLDWLLDPAGDHEVASVELGPRGRLDIVPQFMPAMSAGEVLRQGFVAALERWRAYDAVVLDAGPVLAYGDGAHMAPHGTVCVLVCDEERSGRRRLAATVTSLRRRGARVVLALVTATGTRLTGSTPAPAPGRAPAGVGASRDPLA